MTSELVVDVQPKEVSIALLEDKSLVELQSEGRNISFSVGNMYLGRIKKLMPGLNACFVDVGYEKDAFLHYLDLGPQFNSLEKFVKQTLSDKKKLTSISKATLLPDLDKDGTVSNTLKQDGCPRSCSFERSRCACFAGGYGYGYGFLWFPEYVGRVYSGRKSGRRTD